MGYPVEVQGLTKRFTVKKPLPEEEMGLWKSLRRLLRRAKTRETILAVNDVSFQIGKGELFGLLGPNGAGKTTLVKTLCTLLWPTGGTAVINSHDIRREPARVRASIGTVLDVQMGWYGRLSCRQNLLFYGQLYGIPPLRIKSRIAEVLQLVGLADKADDWQQKLSSGMQRKLDISRALLPDPPILLLDEPTIQLDPSSARELRRTIKEELCRKGGKAVLWTTHNINEAEEICDRVAIMHKGKIIAIGSPGEVKALIKSGENIVAEVSEVTPDLLASLKRLEGVVHISPSRLSEGTEQLKIEVRESRIAPQVADTILRNRGRLHSLRVQEPTLEEALIKLTGG